MFPNHSFLNLYFQVVQNDNVLFQNGSCLFTEQEVRNSPWSPKNHGEISSMEDQITFGCIWDAVFTGEERSKTSKEDKEDKEEKDEDLWMRGQIIRKKMRRFWILEEVKHMNSSWYDQYAPQIMPGLLIHKQNLSSLGKGGKQSSRKSIWHEYDFLSANIVQPLILSCLISYSNWYETKSWVRLFIGGEGDKLIHVFSKGNQV